MSRLEFETVTLKNFGSYRRLVFQIQPGRHLISGAVGVGKTTILEAIVAALYPKAVRDSDPTFNGEGDGMVAVDVRVDGEPYRIERDFRPKAKIASPRLFKNGEEVSRRLPSATEDVIADLIGIPHDLFINTVVVAQSLPVNFPELGGTARKAVIESLLGFDVWDDIRKDFQGEAKRESLNKSKAQGDFDAKKHDMVALNARVATLKQVAAETEDDTLARIAEKKARLAEVREEVAAAKARLVVPKSLATLHDEAKTLSSTITLLARQAADLRHVCDEQECPTCQRPYPDSQLKAADEKARHVTDKIIRLRALADDIDVQQAKVRALVDRLGDAEDEAEALRRDIATILDNPVGDLQKGADLHQLTDELEFLVDEVHVLKEALDKQIELLDGLKYMDSLLQPSSLFRTEVLGDKLSYINKLIGGITPLIFRGVDCKLVLNDETRRDNGVHLEILKDGHGRTYKQLSGGQKRSISLILIFAFQRFQMEASGVSTNLLGFDEIFEGLDRGLVARVLNALDTLFPTTAAVYVVSHRQDIKESFDSVVAVSMNDEGESVVDEAEGYVS